MRCDWLGLEQWLNERRSNPEAGAELIPPFGHLQGSRRDP